MGRAITGCAAGVAGSASGCSGEWDGDVRGGVPDGTTSLAPGRSSPRVECGASVVEADMTRDMTLTRDGLYSAYFTSLWWAATSRRCHHLLAFDALMFTMFIVSPYTNEYPMHNFKVDASLCPDMQCP